MTVRFTREALRDLDDIADYVTLHHPAAAPALAARLRAVLERIERWPESGRRVAERTDVHVVPLGKYPYKLFYRATGDGIEILHIHHAARAPWPPETT